MTKMLAQPALGCRPDHLRVLMVNKFLYPNGGSETYMLRLGEYLSSQGHEVQYFGMEHERRTVGNRVGAYTSNMDFHGGSPLSKLAYPIKTVYSIEARRKIRMVLDDFQPDIVHLNNFNYQITPSVILEIAKWREEEHRACSIIYTAHDYQLVCPNHMLRNPSGHENCEDCLGGNPTSCIRGRCIHGSGARSAVGAAESAFWKARGAYRHLDLIVCPSEFVKSKLDSDPVLGSKTVFVPNFVDVPETSRPSDGESYALYFGRLSEEKGVGTLLEACRLVSDVPFVFAGDGPLRDQVDGTENARFLGFLQGDELWGLVAGASFCVCPSEWYEVFGLTVAEAMALGAPVIGSRIGGIPEIIDDGVNGMLVTPGDARELAGAIRTLWNDATLTARFSRAAKSAARLTVAQYSEIVYETSRVWMCERRYGDDSPTRPATSAKKAVLLADDTEENLSDFILGLSESTGIEWALESRIPSSPGGLSKIENIKRYATYFAEPWRVFLARDDYSAIVGWQQFYSLIFGLYCDMFRVDKSVYVCALNSVYKQKHGLIGHVYRSFWKRTAESSYVDSLHFSSESYLPYVADSLGLDKDKLFCVPFGVADRSGNVEAGDLACEASYALAIGRSNRDFDWLVDEWRDIDMPLVIISDAFQPKGVLPSNVTLLDDVSGEAQYPYFAMCELLIMPIDDPKVCSGDTVLLTGMSFGKTVIVTTPSALGDEYIADGVNGYLCPKDHGKLARLIRTVLEEDGRTGTRARESFVESYSLETMGKRIGTFLKPKLNQPIPSLEEV